jgi:hypothetical protein
MFLFHREKTAVPAFIALLLSGNVLISPPIGVDCAVGQRDLSTFASRHHALDGSEQKCSGLGNLAQLAGTIKVIPSNLKGSFNDPVIRFAHERKTR